MLKILQRRSVILSGWRFSDGFFGHYVMLCLQSFVTDVLLSHLQLPNSSLFLFKFLQNVI